MRVYLIPHNGTPRAHDCDGNLYDLQSLVDGWIEPCAPQILRGQGIELLANEEGLLKMLPLNVNTFPVLFLCGNLVAVGVNEDDFTSLTPEQELFIEAWLNLIKRGLY